MKDDTSLSSYRKMLEEIEHDIAYLTKCRKKCNLKSATFLTIPNCWR